MAIRRGYHITAFVCSPFVRVQTKVVMYKCEIEIQLFVFVKLLCINVKLKFSYLFL